MTPLKIPYEPGQVSDGFHTFDELYTHRHLLFCALSHMAGLRRYAPYRWKSRRHWWNGIVEHVWDGWFIAGIELSGRMITYHLPDACWNLFDGIERVDPPPHNGHTSQDVIERLRRWLEA